MNYKLVAGILASVLSIIAFTPYVIHTAQGKTRPHPVT